MNDLIDFPVSSSWQRYYASRGMCSEPKEENDKVLIIKLREELKEANKTIERLSIALGSKIAPKTLPGGARSKAKNLDFKVIDGTPKDRNENNPNL